MYRTTGVQIDVGIGYSNKNRDTGRPDPTITTVTAEADLTAKKGWAGLGALPTIYAVYPNGNRYHSISRYRQVPLLLS